VRLFSAFELPPGAHGGIADAFARVRALAPKVKWVSPESMHLTLHFFGEVADTGVGDFAAVFDDVSLRVPAIPIRLAEVGFFPGDGPPKVLWVGISGGVDRMRAFWTRFTEKLQALRAPGGPLGDWTPDSRGFSPHITVARAGAVPLSRQWAAEVRLPAGEFLVEHCVLFQSILGPGGARYVPLRTIQFSGEAA